MTFALSQRSLANLEGVHPDLVRVVKRGIELTTVDFGVTEGVRSTDRQIELVKAGASQTYNSKHFVQPDGWGHAVDLCAYVGRQVRWDWSLYYLIAKGMQAAATELNVTLTWGGVWDKTLNDLGDIEEEVAGYVTRRKAANQRAFIDGPHYQITKKVTT